MPFSSRALALLLVHAIASVAACGDSTSRRSDSGTHDAESSRDAASDAPDPRPDAEPEPARDGGTEPTPDGGGGARRRLIGARWSLPVGPAEDYRCILLTLTEPIFIRGFYPVAPEGTHHTVLSVNPTPREPDGERACSGLENGEQMIYGSGVGTRPLELPPGIAVRVDAGQQLFLSLHLFNTNRRAPLSGETGIDVVMADAAEVREEAEAILAGTVAIFIPPRVTDYAVTGRCTQRRNQRLLGLMPHMHQYAVHQRVVLERAGSSPRVLFDAEYTFDDQQYTVFDPPIEMRAGDVLRVTCTYDNPTGMPVTFGESSNQEMCFAGLYRVPASPDGVVCTD
ncbi:MAG: hypothetical protein NZ898_05360 [Myxococcota bacterium]|nr:hypothetical protein [Myxococcota bacterium]MDW8362091.1 hypothetical protein [Myxococcales bacterium]